MPEAGIEPATFSLQVSCYSGFGSEDRIRTCEALWQWVMSPFTLTACIPRNYCYSIYLYMLDDVILNYISVTVHNWSGYPDSNWEGMCRCVLSALCLPISPYPVNSNLTIIFTTTGSGLAGFEPAFQSAA